MTLSRILVLLVFVAIAVCMSIVLTKDRWSAPLRKWLILWNVRRANRRHDFMDTLTAADDSSACTITAQRDDVVVWTVTVTDQSAHLPGIIQAIRNEVVYRHPAPRKAPGVHKWFYQQMLKQWRNDIAATTSALATEYFNRYCPLVPAEPMPAEV